MPAGSSGIVPKRPVVVEVAVDVALGVLFADWLFAPFWALWINQDNAGPPAPAPPPPIGPTHCVPLSGAVNDCPGG